MDLIHWTYDYMYKWYVKLYEKNENKQDIYAFVYETKKPSKKDKSKVEPFITRNITVVEKLDIALFKRGLYTLIDLKSPIRWIFFVHPEEKSVGTHTGLYADHYSFCYQKSDLKKPIHFHSTIYIPQIIDDRLIHYSGHNNDYFGDNIDIPRNGDVKEIIKNNIHQPKKQLLLDIIRRPWNDGIVGAAKKANTNKDKSKARPILSEEFCNKWIQKNIQALWAFGLREKDGIIWSIRIKTGREKQGIIYPAYYFTTSTEDELEFQNTLAVKLNTTL